MQYYHKKFSKNKKPSNFLREVFFGGMGNFILKDFCTPPHFPYYEQFITGNLKVSAGPFNKTILEHLKETVHFFETLSVGSVSGTDHS